MPKFIRNFLNDDDGFSQKDFIMVVFTLIYTAFLVIAFYLSITGTVNSQTIEIIRSLDGVIITVVGGVFGIQAVREFRNYQSPPDNFPVERPGGENRGI